MLGADEYLNRFDNLAERAALRRRMRQARAQLGNAARSRAARDVAGQLAATMLLKPRLRIAAYASISAELGTTPLLRLLVRRGAIIFLPRVDSARAARMSFAPVGSRWRLNRFAIAEPANTRRQSACFMNIVLLPVVAFDKFGTRLGMGGGFYDRALAFKLRRHSWYGPKLIGLAYEFQRADHIPRRPHDVQLDAIVTPRGIHWFSSRGSDS